VCMRRVCERERKREKITLEFPCQDNIVQKDLTVDHSSNTWKKKIMESNYLKELDFDIYKLSK